MKKVKLELTKSQIKLLSYCAGEMVDGEIEDGVLALYDSEWTEKEVEKTISTSVELNYSELLAVLEVNGKISRGLYQLGED